MITPTDAASLLGRAMRICRFGKQASHIKRNSQTTFESPLEQFINRRPTGRLFRNSTQRASDNSMQTT